MTAGVTKADSTATPTLEAAPLRIYAAPPAVRKGRFLALLLLVNWGVMGIYVLSQGVSSLVGGLAFVLGLFALIGGLAYLRASRNATTVPLIEIEGDRLRHRRFSSTEWSTVAIGDFEAIEERSRDSLTLRTRTGERESISWLTASDSDRERLIERLQPL